MIDRPIPQRISPREVIREALQASLIRERENQWIASEAAVENLQSIRDCAFET